MANKDDYLSVYQRFFECFAKTVNPNDQLPVRLASYKLVNLEVIGGIVDWTTQYLTQKQCPPCLLGPLIKIVIEEIRKSCKKNPISCGYNTSAEVYEPLKLMQAVMAKTNEVCLRYMDNSMLCSLPTPGPPHYVVSVAAIKNTRRKMEDRHVVIHDLNTMFNIQEASPSSYYAIFDGHAGHDAAAYSAVHLHQFLAESKHFVNNPEQALIDAFYKTDAMFIDKEEKFCSGTTAVCALLKPKERMLYIAWVGDSQALIVSKGVLYQCVVPHKPGREDEKHRIEQQGGEVVHWGTWRVNGQLAVSRAIGDREYKPYVTAIPEVQEIRMTANTDFLILACDGLWDFLSEEEAATTVYNMVCTNSDDIDPISDRLVQLAKKQGSTDNISVIVVFLREPSKVAADAHWANRNTTTTMETGLDNANAANNPFANSNGAEILQQKDDFLLNQQKDEFLLNLSSGFKQNGGAIASPTTNNLHFADLDMNSANGKRQQIDEFDEDEDMGPETDVDAVDDIPSPLDVKQMMFHQESEENQKDNTFNPFTDIQEKGAFETDIDLELQKQQSEEFEQGSTREETPTPPADKVHDATVEENVADSGEESEDEWNYFKGNSAAADNSATLKTDQEVAELTKTIEEDEEQDMSQLNPNAAEFVPISSPTRNVSSPACRALVDDKVIAQSPRRATPAEIDINLPNPIEFESEVKNRPSEVFNNGHDSENGHKLSSQEVMENLLNGKNLDEIEFYPSTPSKIVNSNPEEFHFGPNATPFSTPAKMLDQSEALSTKALFGDESTASYLEGKTLEGTLLMGESSSPNETEEDPVTLPKLKEQDPMSMSFYQDENEHSIFDLNQVQELPENVDEFIGGDKNQEVNEKENANPEISNEFMLGVSQLPKTPEPDNLSESLEEKEDADVEKDMDVEKMQLVCDLPPAVSPSLEEVAKQPLPITPEPTELLEEDVKQPLPITPEPTELLEEDVKQPLPITPEPTEFLEEVAKQPLPITPEPTEHLEEVAKQPLPITPEPTEHVEDQNIDTKCEVNKQSDGTEETDLCKLTNSNLLASDFPETNEGINAMMSDAKKMSEMDSSPETEELSQISDAGDEVPPLCKSPEMTSDLDQFESDIKEVVQEACQAPQSQSSPTEGGVDEIVDNVTEAVEDLDPLKLCIKEEEQHSLPVHETDKKIDDMIESVEPTSDLDQVEPEIKEDLQEMCQIPKTEHLLPDNELVDVLYDAKSTEMISDLDQVEPVVEMKKVDDVVEMITEAMVENVEISPELKDLNVEETSQMEEHAELPIHQKGDEITESKTEIPIDSAISETVEMMDKVEKDGEVLAAKDDILDITQDSGEILETKLEQPIETPQYESLDTLEKAEKEIEIKEQEIEIKEKEIEIKEEEKPEVEVCDEFKSKFEDHGVELLEEPAESQPSLTPEPSNDVSIREEEIDIDNGGDIKSDDKVSDDLRDLDSPMEDVTTSIKDDVSSSEIIEEAKDISTEKEIIIQDSFSNEPVLETSQPNITEELMEASQSAVVEKSPEVIPEPVKEEVEDSREFLERSTVPEMLSPLSPATQPPIDDDNNILDVTDKEVDISSSKVDENIVQEATTDLIKTDTIAPQYPEETTVVATPSEEIKTLVAPEKQEEPTLPDVSKVDDSDKKVSDAAVIGTTAAVAATAAAVAAGVTAAAKPKEKKSLDKKPAAKKPAPSKSPQTSTKPTPAKLLTKPTASKTLAHPPAKSPATTVKATTKTVASKTPSPSTRTPTKTSSAKPAPKLDSTIPVKAAEKKTSTMTNGEVKGPTKPTTMLKKTSLGTKATPPKTTPSKISPTKADAPKAAPKSAPKQPLAATKTSLSSAKPRPNSLASTGAGGATKTATTLKSTVTKTTTLTSPKPMGAPPKPRPTSAPLARPKPAGTSTKPKAPDTEKQIKETVNKQLTTTRTSIAAKTSTTSSRVTASTTATKKAETKAPTTTRTTTTKTTTIKATKKPAEITRLTGKAKPITTKTATKPQENGTTEQLTTVMQETTAILTTDPQLVKDLSPIENKFIIDNSQVTENNVAD